MRDSVPGGDSTTSASVIRDPSLRSPAATDTSRGLLRRYRFVDGNENALESRGRVAGTEEQNWRCHPVQEFVRHAAEPESTEPAPAMRRHDGQVDVVLTNIGRQGTRRPAGKQCPLGPNTVRGGERPGHAREILAISQSQVVGRTWCCTVGALLLHRRDRDRRLNQDEMKVRVSRLRQSGRGAKACSARLEPSRGTSRVRNVEVCKRLTFGCRCVHLRQG